MQWLRNRIEEAPEGLRDALTESVTALMSAEVDALCGAEYGERSDERVNHRNGYRERDWDTRLGTIELPVPKLRSGSYFPSWLLRPSAEGASLSARSAARSARAQRVPDP